MEVSAPKGTEDIFGERARIWRRLEGLIHELCADYFMEEIRTPVFEHTELFVRGVGETTDIVQKEMYTFTDQGNRSLTLRPENTAGVARAFIELGMTSNPLPMKMYYIGPNFRAEKPQKGRQRQFHQFGVECYGSTEPVADAEIISVGHEFFKRVGLKNIEIHINSIGNNESRKIYNKILREYIDKNYDDFCPLCKERAKKNPLRVLDCKTESCKKLVEAAPKTLDNLLPDCKEHFESVKRCLDLMSVPYVVDTGIVRGLDYYTRTVFEFLSTDIGAQSACGGGGRYDNLIAECGGADVPAVGYAIGIERVVLALLAQNRAEELSKKEKPTLFIGNIGEKGFNEAISLVRALRSEKIACFMDLNGRSLKAQMKYADKTNADYSMVIGDEEAEKSACEVKNMETGEKTYLKFSEIALFMEKANNSDLK